jgi:endonuclease/exonuclease/phosphatase family metal-dependent hydrolase
VKRNRESRPVGLLGLLLVICLAGVPAGSTPQRMDSRGQSGSMASRKSVTKPSPQSDPHAINSKAGSALQGLDAFRALTFNAGLAVGILPHARERAPKIGAALAGLPVDLMCVQEVWLEEHWADLERGARPRFQHTFRPTPAASGPERCNKRELEPVIDCMRQYCSTADPDSIGWCAGEHCGGFAQKLSPACTRCLLRDPSRSLERIERQCSSSVAAPSEPVSGGKALAYGGSYGLGILSSVPLKEREFLAFDLSRGIARGVMHVAITPPRYSGTLHLFCTHLTPVTSGRIQPLSGQARPEEQARQIDMLLAFIERKAPRGTTAVLLGDLNTGPGSENVRPTLPQHYQRFVRAGFESPYLSILPARCTFCANNSMNGGGGAGGSLIDHALLRDFRGSARAMRALDEPIEIEVADSKLKSAYSDHYGIVVALEPPAS